MFTGIIEELGIVAALDYVTPDAATLTIDGPLVATTLGLGDSIAVNGACLTVTEHGSGRFGADVMAPTLRHTSLRAVQPGMPVNLERAVPADGRLGGHLVQGHIDDTATVLTIEPTAHWTVLRLAPPDALGRYLADRGSVALDGVSLTVSAIGPGWFEVSLIPTTLRETTLGRLSSGDIVNLEVDVVAKYVERLVNDRQPAGGELS